LILIYIYTYMTHLNLLQLRDWREERRLLAWELKRHGWKQKRIAEVLEVSPGAVSRWLNLAEKNGREALRVRSTKPRQSTFSKEKLDRVQGLLAKIEQQEYWF
jgi:predicted transcriptional regulator